MQIKTTFAPGYPDLFGGIANPYRPPVRLELTFRQSVEQQSSELIDFIRKNPFLHANEIAEKMGVSRDSVYWKIRSLYKMKILDQHYKKCDDGVKRKQWFYVEPGMKWSEGFHA